MHYRRSPRNIQLRHSGKSGRRFVQEEFFERLGLHPDLTRKDLANTKNILTRWKNLKLSVIITNNQIQPQNRGVYTEDQNGMKSNQSYDSGLDILYERESKLLTDKLGRNESGRMVLANKGLRYLYCSAR